MEADIVIIGEKRDIWEKLHNEWKLGKIFGDTEDSLKKEDERLYYVAMTRAKEKLFFIS